MNTTALAVMQPHELDTIHRAATLLAVSGYFDGKGEGKQAVAMMASKIMAGREMGFGPFASVNGVHIINGKPTIGANLMASAVKGSGRYDYRVRVMSAERCELEFFERIGDKRESLGVSEFTMQDAQAAGVLNNPTWKKYPRNMLFARALSNGVRWYCPDVFSGNAVYVPEELGADVDEEGNVVNAAFTVTTPAAPHAAQDAWTPDSTQASQNATQGLAGASVEGDMIFDKDADGTPPHQRCFGIGLSVFGEAWNNGGRKWMLRAWSKKATPDNVRESLAALSDDEKDALADYMNEHRDVLQEIWRQYKLNKQAEPHANGVAP